MTKIYIESAECRVPKIGTQQHLKKLQEELRRDNPSLAAKVEALPFYANPDGPYSGDDWAVFNWGWFVEDKELMGGRSYVRIEQLPLIREKTYGEVERHFVSGVQDDESWIDYSFHVKATYAFAVLKATGMIPADSILGNADERPLAYDDEEELEAEAAVAEDDDLD